MWIRYLLWRQLLSTCAVERYIILRFCHTASSWSSLRKIHFFVEFIVIHVQLSSPLDSARVLPPRLWETPIQGNSSTVVVISLTTCPQMTSVTTLMVCSSSSCWSAALLLFQVSSCVRFVVHEVALGRFSSEHFSVNSHSTACSISLICHPG
jgi:hypothetical protein